MGMGIRSDQERAWGGRMTFLAGVVAATGAALYWALRRNRQQWLEDTANIDRRWDRSDRLANTWQEDERWNGRGERGDNRRGHQEDARSASAGRELPIAADIYSMSGAESHGDERQP